MGIKEWYKGCLFNAVGRIVGGTDSTEPVLTPIKTWQLDILDILTFYFSHCIFWRDRWGEL